MLEAHLFIMPLVIPGILEVTGIIGDARYVAVQKKAQAEKKAKALEERARLQAKVGAGGGAVRVQHCSNPGVAPLGTRYTHGLLGHRVPGTRTGRCGLNTARTRMLHHSVPGTHKKCWRIWYPVHTWGGVT